MKPISFWPGEKLRILRVIERLWPALNPKKRYILEIKEHREKRSLDANAYFWVLVHKVAEKMEIPVTELYHNAIKDIGGVSEHYCGKPEAIEKLCKAWREMGIGWITETYESKLPGVVNVTLYYGSSTYDTKQMSRLIDNVVQDCQNLGIETEPPERLAQMMEKWDAQINKGNGNTSQGQGSSLGA